MDTVYRIRSRTKEKIDLYDIVTCCFVISLFVFENARFARIYSVFQVLFLAVSIYYMLRKCLFFNSAVKWAGVLGVYIVLVNLLSVFSGMNTVRTVLRNVIRLICFAQYIHNKNYKRLLQFIFVGGLLSGLFLIEEIRSTGLVSTEIRYAYQNRIGANIAGGNQNIAAMNMCLAFLCAFPLYQLENEKKKRIIMLFAAAIAITSMLTGTRKIILCYLFASLLFIIIEKKGRIQKLALLLILITTGFYLLTSIPELYYTIGYRFDRNVGVFFSSKGADEIRALLIRKSLELFRQNPIIGVGFGNVEKMIGLYSHCNYTEILASGGIIGMCIYYFPYIRTLVKAIKHKTALRTSLTVMILSLLLLEITQITYLYSVFWVYITVVFSIQNRCAGTLPEKALE